MEMRTLRPVLFWAAMVPAPLWVLIRIFGWESSLLAYSPAAQLLAFTPYVALLSVVPLVLASVRRQWWAAGPALIATVALLFLVIPRAVGSGPPPAAAGGPELRLLTANLSLGDADAAAIVRVVRDRRVDVLLLQEFTPAAEAGFEKARISDLLPYRQAHPSALAAGSALFSRYPLQDADVRKNWGGFYQVHATITVPGGRSILAESVHVCSPFSLGQLHCWRTDLAREPRASDVPPGSASPLRVLAGDFNATLDHAPLRTLIGHGHGYRDAADSTGSGWTGTWGPYARHPFIPPVAVDHVLVDRDIAVRSLDAFGIPHTDHRAVLAVLVIPPAVAAGS